jgi:hypothetical protein
MWPWSALTILIKKYPFREEFGIFEGINQLLNVSKILRSQALFILNINPNYQILIKN